MEFLRRRLVHRGCLYNVTAHGFQIERYAPREPGKEYHRAKFIRYASSLGQPMWIILRGELPVAFCPEFTDASKSTQQSIVERLYELDEE